MKGIEPQAKELLDEYLHSGHGACPGCQGLGVKLEMLWGYLELHFEATTEISAAREVTVATELGPNVVLADWIELLPFVGVVLRHPEGGHPISMGLGVIITWDGHEGVANAPGAVRPESDRTRDREPSARIEPRSAKGRPGPRPSRATPNRLAGRTV